MFSSDMDQHTDPHPSTVGGILVSPCGVITEYFGEQLMAGLKPPEKLSATNRCPVTIQNKTSQ